MWISSTPDVNHHECLQELSKGKKCYQRRRKKRNRYRESRSKNRRQKDHCSGSQDKHPEKVESPTPKASFLQHTRISHPKFIKRYIQKEHVEEKVNAETAAIQK